MFHIRRVSIVPYSVEQMFDLINDISSYNEFIPGCKVIKILKKNNNELIAEINFIENNIIKSLITHNYFIKNKSIVIFLINSPFKFFYGRWNFISIDNVVSSLEYISNYEFQSIFFEKICNFAFQNICCNIIKVFVSRANQIYGIRNEFNKV